MKSLSRVQLFATLRTVGHKAPPSMGFPRQEYWSGLPFPSPNPGSIPESERSAGEGTGCPQPVFLGFPCGSAGKESACHVRDLGLIPGLGTSPREGKGYILLVCSSADGHLGSLYFFGYYEYHSERSCL